MDFLIPVMNVLLVICSLFLICLVLIQRGKGGGLAGAFGGMGGSSAFGTKAGDVFTHVTVITAIVWFALALIQVLLMNRAGRVSAYQDAAGASSSSSEVPALPGMDLGAGVGAPAPDGGGAPGTAPPASTPSAESGLPPAIEDEAATGAPAASSPAPVTIPAPAPATDAPAGAGEG